MSTDMGYKSANVIAVTSRLPLGTTCSDCEHVKRCVGLGITKFTETLCDFAPSRFRLERYDLVAHLNRQRKFSLLTFGPGTRTQGIIEHIRKELLEIASKPLDVEEWIDVVLLALDGAWRAGAETNEGPGPRGIAMALLAKQARNEARKWPDRRTAKPGTAIEHVRSDNDPTPPNARGISYATGPCASSPAKGEHMFTSVRDEGEDFYQCACGVSRDAFITREK